MTKFETIDEPPYETNGNVMPSAAPPAHAATMMTSAGRARTSAPPEELREAVLGGREMRVPRATITITIRSIPTAPIRPSSWAIAE